MDLTSDIIGTSPKYPKIVNHGAFEVDAKTYDNYPSDNNPVRVVPKLSEMWAHGRDKNINLIPNISVQSLGVHNADEQNISENIVREAKKAMMAGLKGKEVAEHLRSRFVAKHIQASKGALEKLAGEQGLLGNVYIDASAFTSYKDAEQFLNQHRNRLAREIVIKDATMTPEVVSLLASRFHKNVVSSLDYNKDLFDNYKMHLVASGKISRDYVIDSKDALRMAFLVEKEQPKEPAKKEVKAVSQEVISQELGKMMNERTAESMIARDEMIIGKVRPILEFAQAQFAKGKEASDVKEMLRSKFVMPDLKDASEGLAVVASGDLSPENVNKLIDDGKITTVMAEELKRVAKKFPVRAKKVQDYEEAPKTAGIRGFFYALSGKAMSPEMDVLKTASINALLKGISPERIQVKLLDKVSADDANRIMSEAISSMNSVSAGVKANAPVRAKKELFPEKPKDVNFGLFASELPSKECAIEQNQELMGFYEGANSEIDVSASEIPAPQEVGEILNRDGIDSIL